MMIDNESMRLLLDVVENKSLTVSDLQLRYGWTPRNWHHKLAVLNEQITQMGFAAVQERQQKLHMSDELAHYLLTDASVVRRTLFIEEAMRLPIVYLYIFVRQSAVSNSHLQWLLRVSKNTALADVKLLREFCLVHHVQINYTRKEGYHLSGTEQHKRQLAMLFLNELLAYPLGLKMVCYVVEAWQQAPHLNKMKQQVEQCVRQAKVPIPSARLHDLTVLYRLLVMRGKHDVQFTKTQRAVLQNSSWNALASDLCHTIGIQSPKEQQYLSAQLLAIVAGTAQSSQNKEVTAWAYQISAFVSQQMAVSFADEEALVDGLLQHLLPAYYRMLFDIPVNNPLTKQVMRDYPFLFETVQRALSPIERALGKQVPLDEVAFVTMFFGGQLHYQSSERRLLHAKVVCPNGVSASIMLQAQLQRMFPTIHFTVEAYKPQNNWHQVDMVFSTVMMEASIPVYVTKPLLSVSEQNALKLAVGRDFQLEQQVFPTGKALLGIVQRYATVTDAVRLEQELDRVIRNYVMNERSDVLMLQDLLTEDFIHFSDKALTWQEAIEQSVAPLVAQRRVDERYAQAIIQRVNEFGPYIHLGGGVAIPHARPEDGVHQLGMSFLKLRQPVCLADDPKHEVSVLIALAAVDNSSHLTALAELTKILSHKERLAQLKSAESIDDVRALITKKEDVV